MTKYYSTNATLYRVEDDNKKYVYFKSTDEWRSTNFDIETFALDNDDVIIEENLTEKWINHYKQLSNF